MNYLFIHQNSPGQYLHVMRRLAEDAGNRVVALGEHRAAGVEGVQKASYEFSPRGLEAAHPHARDFTAAVARAEAVARSCQQLRALGFMPDIVVGHTGWGELLNVKDVWPDTPVLGYYEFYYRLAGADVGFDPEFPLPERVEPRVRAKNAVNLLSLQVTDAGQTPTRWQRSTYPPWARRRINLVPEGVDLAVCVPDPTAATRPLTIGAVPTVEPDDILVTYVARNLEPYRGFHILMRALPRLLAAVPKARVILVGGDGVSYGNPSPQGRCYREILLEELRGLLDPDRVHFAGRIPYRQHLALLQRSDAHVYLTYPFVASWSLREAMACGCRIVASDTPPVREFLTDRQNALLTPFLDPRALADRIIEMIDDADLATRLSLQARRQAEFALAMDRHHMLFDAVVGTLAGSQAA